MTQLALVTRQDNTLGRLAAQGFAQLSSHAAKNPIKVGDADQPWQALRTARRFRCKG
jgi:hypothetical protein